MDMHPDLLVDPPNSSHVLQLVGTIAKVFLTIGTGDGIGNNATILEMHAASIHALMCAWLGQIVLLFAIGLGKAAGVDSLLSVQGSTFLKKSFLLIALATSNVDRLDPLVLAHLDDSG